MENASRFIASSALFFPIRFRNKTLHDQTATDFATTLTNFTIPIIPTLAILVFASAIILRLVKSKTSQSYVSLPPGPQPWPVVGNVPELLYNAPGYKWLHSLLHSYSTSILCVRLGSVHVIAVNSPDIAREFLKKQDATFASRPITVGNLEPMHCSISHTTQGFRQRQKYGEALQRKYDQKARLQQAIVYKWRR